jgi:hypothetical protein
VLGVGDAVDSAAPRRRHLELDGRTAIVSCGCSPNVDVTGAGGFAALSNTVQAFPLLAE